jgi:hypothetical protein
MSWAQGIVVTGLPHSKDQENNAHPSGRTKSLELPFWDDFSQTKTTFANPDLWLYGRSVRVNDGLAIRPPSIRVATFDGIDSLGKPYNVNDVLSKGYADKLVSQSIDLTVIPDDERDSVYLSYQYQLKGNGETPDEGDRLLVSFFDKNSEWVPVDTIENDGSFDIDKFYPSVIKIEDPRFYHADFKFMIKNFARLSGPYDTWHVDYIYLNKGKTAISNNFPDRTISEPLTSLFGVYSAIPFKHFIANGGTMSSPSIVATSQQSAQEQPVDASNQATISYWVGKDSIALPPALLDNHEDVNDPLKVGTFSTISAHNSPDLLSLAGTADSIQLNYKFWISTKDNESIFPTSPTDDTLGDYDPRIYSPIDFRWNDTTSTNYFIASKYAYDDGIAEYGAGLNQPGAQMAYKYTLVGAKQAAITYLEMYFPRFGDESSQVLELRIWGSNLKEKPLHAEVASLQRSEQNKFWLKKISPPVSVDSVFYIGWKQNATAVIATGLDKSNDTGDRMYYNTNGDWIQNTTVHGSLMFRPVLGKGIGEDPDGLGDERTLTVYPNPSSGTFNFAGVADHVSVYDMTGRSISFLSESTSSETIVTLQNASHGIYIIKAQVSGAVRTAKVMVR